MHRGGGQERYYEEESLGDNEMVLVTEEEVKPKEKYYMVDPNKSNVFYETSFEPTVSWETIIEFVSTKKIYRKNAKDKRKEEGPQLRVDSQRLF
jgi:hypothetical protein